jgi:DNA-binding MarR family transcriptional regulator
MNDDFDTLVLLTTRFLHKLRQKSKDTTGGREATMLQVNGLISLKNNPNSTMGDFSESLGLSLSSATQLAERLSGLGYLKRAEDNKDRRMVLLSLTKKGALSLEKIHQSMRGRLKKVFSKVPQKDIKELIRIQKDLLNS